MKTRRQRAPRASRKKRGGSIIRNDQIRFKAADVMEAFGVELTPGGISLEMFFRLSGIPLTPDGFVKREDVRRSMTNRGLGHLFDAVDARLERY